MLRIYSQEMVTRRLAPLVVALAVAFAPVALEACQVSCLSHATMDMASGAHHHHHHAAPTAPVAAATAAHAHHHTPLASVPGVPAPSSASITSGPHLCDHGDDLPASAGALQAQLSSPDLAVVAFSVPRPQGRSLAGRDRTQSFSSVLITLTTQLRV